MASWEKKTLGQCAQIGRTVSGDHMLMVIPPDQIILGAEASGETSNALG